LVGDLFLLPPWYRQQRKYHGHTLPANSEILYYLDVAKITEAIPCQICNWSQGTIILQRTIILCIFCVLLWWIIILRINKSLRTIKCNIISSSVCLCCHTSPLANGVHVKFPNWQSNKEPNIWILMLWLQKKNQEKW
jgi:hypothetical protein